ncbi:hypothetical protein [Sphingomonas sp. PAMC 26621]|uniref:hypothetical protein n=1 Tax=Sphingomonas sp. PAMC 26621 TaxID=1112213 RepID=UPI00111109DE|nr:hypothetical protein [Sphingomonas sp. PAMC 26621]
MIATVTTDRPLGGEAAFIGKLRFHDGCLVAVTDGKIATPIFNRGVVLQPSGRAIYDPHSNVRVPINASFSAAAAWLRDGGTGWPIADIEGIYGAHVPERCPAETIVKLHDFRLLAAR